MKRARFTNLAAIVLTLPLLLLWGCSDQSTGNETPSGDELNLTDTYGGYKATSEAPGFGDAEILGQEGGEPANDPMSLSPQVDSLRNLGDRDVYSLELLWGRLQYDSLATEFTDWSGSLEVERGAIVGIRLIQFEADDQIVRPRDTCTTLEWVSKTITHYDGILVYIYDPEPDSFATENTLTLTTTPYSRVFGMSELDSISEMVDVGDNQVSINGFKTELMACQNGYFQGRWRRQGNGDRGRFDGRWISEDGYLMGHVKGHFGVRDDGEQVIFGKWIGVGGAFRGLMRGVWGSEADVDSPEATSGWMSGRWDNAAGTRLGDFGGDWVATNRYNNQGENSGEAHRGHGLHRGQWQEACQ